MITTYQFPILKSLNVTPQVTFEIITEGVSTMRVMYSVHRSMGNDKQAMDLYDKILQGERLLNFIRLNLPLGDVNQSGNQL